MAGQTVERVTLSDLTGVVRVSGASAERMLQLWSDMLGTAIKLGARGGVDSSWRGLKIVRVAHLFSSHYVVTLDEIITSDAGAEWLQDTIRDCFRTNIRVHE